ncbi:LysR family transcriptional regulator [Burkholderia pseudomultivorans]|uniref:LysR family transcriptional regulator n=1 Tax=Burkholderia pseudomultivorans TaxID=1207504 RepID=UPI000754CB3C|nr:LysR family transcriptional regulator [Burkholderia pseudomultivorans]KWI47804.1 LysR family transcriptional regulator [Burkholderia pseudomultivorans]
MTDFNNADLNLLRVFQTILEERGLTRAGSRLGLSQPAVSYALGRLRALFNDPLFVRTPEGMLPTPAAQRLAPLIGRALVAVREALEDGEQFDPATSTREFRISMSDIGEQAFLPLLCEKLQTIAPSIQISADQVPLSHIEERMRLGQLDFAIGNLPALKPVTRFALLFNEEYACMTRKRPGLPSRKLSAAQFVEMKHVAVMSSDNSHVVIDDAMRAGGLHRSIALRVPHFTVIPLILQRTDWMVTLPRGVAQALNEFGQFAIFPTPVPIAHFESTLHWHDAYDAEQGNRWFRALVIDTLTQYRRDLDRRTR